MLVLLQIVNYGLIWVTISDDNVAYLYLKYKFDVTGTDYAYMLTFLMISFTVGLLLVVPLATNVLKISDSVLLCFCLFSCAAGNLLASFATSLYPMYFLGKLAMCMYISIFSVARAQLTRCIDQEEVGKVFGGIALLAAVIPFGSNPLFRMVFEKTKDNSPPAPQIVTAASIQALAGFLNLFIFTQLAKNLPQEQKENKGGEKEPNEEIVTCL